MDYPGGRVRTRKETEQYLKEHGVDLRRMNVVATISNQETIKSQSAPPWESP